MKSHRPSGLTVITKINILKKTRHTRLKVMEEENSIREHMEKQICEIEMNAVLVGSALKQSGLLIGTKLVRKKLETVLTCPNSFCLNGKHAGKVQDLGCADIKEELHLWLSLGGRFHFKANEIHLQTLNFKRDVRWGLE